MEVDPTSAVKQVLAAWRSLPEVKDFAFARQGFGNSDGGFGIIYPHELDSYDREVDGADISEGYVQVYGFWGPPNGYQLEVLESTYLQILARELLKAGHSQAAEEVQAFITR